MTEDVRGNVTSPRNQVPSADHARHDELLIARFAADDAYPGEQQEAGRLIESCLDCAALAADIRLLSRASTALPAPRRRRDFQLSPEQAEGLRGSFLQRFLRRLAAPGAAALRPVAGVALSLGIVLAVVGSGLPQGAMPAALPAGAPVEMEVGRAAATPAAEMAPGEAPAAPYAQPDSQSESGGRQVITMETEDHFAEDGDGTDTLAIRGDEGPNVLLYGGLLLALISLGALLLSWFARRRERDPYLR